MRLFLILVVIVSRSIYQLRYLEVQCESAARSGSVMETVLYAWGPHGQLSRGVLSIFCSCLYAVHRSIYLRNLSGITGIVYLRTHFINTTSNQSRGDHPVVNQTTGSCHGT